MSIALVFPGQGSQSIGMLAAIAAEHLSVRHTFDEASAVLGQDLWRLVSEGPVELLNSTENTQPVMLSAAVATWRVWCELGGPMPAAVAGHSLGEYSALVCADALDFPAAVELVRFRARLMQQAVPAGVGAMAAVLGMEDAALEAACAEAAQGEVVEAVNYNSPGQIVIAGHAAAVERALALAAQRGAKRALKLPVSVPAHSSLMRAAAAQLRERLEAVEFRVPACRFLSAVDALEHDSPADIRHTLERQLASPVRWTDTLRALLSSGVTQVFECGPGKVLTALNRRIERSGSYQALEDDASIRAALAPVQGAANA